VSFENVPEFFTRRPIVLQRQSGVRERRRAVHHRTMLYARTLAASREIHYIRAHLSSLFLSHSHENEYTGGDDGGVAEIEIYPGVAKSGRRRCFAALRLAMLSNLGACVFAGRGSVCERAGAWPIVMQNDKWAVCEPAPSIIAPAP
jgi:hypothetical protein